MDTDRNLLFAVLALQADMIDRERFVRACTLWAAHKDRPIAELLIEQGWLTAGGKGVVDQLIEFKLRKHGGDVRASLAAATGPVTRDALASVADAEVERSVAVLTAAGRPAEAEDYSTVAPADSAGRNLLYEEIGRGGIGRVLRGRDPALRRDLAVKVLREEYRDDTTAQRRFVEEAQIGGQLQHPGLVPVYELGRFPDHRPYFTMKLVKGRTLAELLQQRPDLAHDLPRFLTIFEQVCQTVAYAHSKGVIHRDLKPSNVMVGPFGEVQVLDWGLAKVLGRREADPAATVTGTVVHTARSGSTAQQDGRTGVVGTPAYMAPEQARGDIEAVDERADVFGLGAILCTILTGQPPHAGPVSEQVLARAAAGDVAEALGRLGGCGTDAELAALCRACLAPRREDRPRDAAEVAARAAAYQAAVRERLRQAELGQAAAQARAATERRARRLTAGLAAAVLLLVVGGGGVAWWTQSERQAREAQAAQRQQEADAAAGRAMAEAGLLLEQALADPLGDAGRFREARAAARKAEELARTGEASADVRRQAAEQVALVEHEAEGAARDRRLLAALQEVRDPREGPKFRRDDKGQMLEEAEPSADEQFAAAFREWGLDVDGTPAAEAAARLKDRPAAVTEVVAALDEWASERRQRRAPPEKWRRAADLAAALDDPGSRRQELRQLLAGGRLGPERALGLLSVALRPVPVPFDAGAGEDRARLRRLADATDPASEPMLGVLTLARALTVAGDEGRAERLLRGALRSRPQAVLLHAALGSLLRGQLRWREAVEEYAVLRGLRPELGEALADALVRSGRAEEGLGLYAQLTRERPDNPWLHLRWGSALTTLGRYEEAEQEYRGAIRLKSDYYRAHFSLGSALSRQGKSQEAEAALRECIRLAPDSAPAHNNLGALLHDGFHRYKEAEAEFRETIRLDPEDPIPHFNLGNALNSQGRHKEAATAYREAIRLEPDYYAPYRRLGDVLNSAGQYKEAEAAYRERIRLRPDDPDGHHALGEFLYQRERYQEAEASYREAVRLRPDAWGGLTGVGNALTEQGRPKEAEAAYREALRLKPDHWPAHNGLGWALNAQGRHKEAEAPLREAMRLIPNDPWPLNNLVVALYGQGRPKEAEAAAREVLRLKPNAVVLTRLGDVLNRQGQHQEAEAAYREAIRLKPDYWPVYNSLGLALNDQGRHKEAEAPLREAIRLNPDSPWSHHHNLGIALNGQLRYEEAEVALREAIRLKPDYEWAHQNLGVALYSQRRFREAEAAYREATRLKPGFAQAHYGLGISLRQQGRFDEALDSLRRSHDLGSKSPGWQLPTAQAARQCERLIAIKPRLAVVLADDAESVTAADRADLAVLCKFGRLPAAAARLYAEALCADPKLADDLEIAYRREAAAEAALAAAGKGTDARRLPDKVIVMLRRQALDWLRADLAVNASQAERNGAGMYWAIRWRLRDWQRDSDLASVRDKEALDWLPDDERRPWQQLWQDVATLLQKVQEPN